MSHIDGEADRRFHDDQGRHVQPRIREWALAAGRGDSNRVVHGSEVARDQANKVAFAAHLTLHRHRGETALVCEPEL